MQVMIEANRFGHYELFELFDEKDIPYSQLKDKSIGYYQSDYQFPGLAQRLGMPFDHKHTDGTVDCPDCGKTVTEFISEAVEYLDDHTGKIITLNE